MARAAANDPRLRRALLGAVSEKTSRFFHNVSLTLGTAAVIGTGKVIYDTLNPVFDGDFNITTVEAGLASTGFAMLGYSAWSFATRERDDETGNDRQTARRGFLFGSIIPLSIAAGLALPGGNDSTDAQPKPPATNPEGTVVNGVPGTGPCEIDTDPFNAGDVNFKVMMVEASLRDAGYAVGMIDGKQSDDPATLSALAAFKQEHGFSIETTFNDAMCDYLNLSDGLANTPVLPG